MHYLVDGSLDKRCMDLFAEASSQRENVPVERDLDWVSGHLINPFANSVALEPYNAGANALNYISGREALEKAARLPVAEPEFLSASWFAQTAASGVGMALPYLIAGKGAGIGLRTLSSGADLSGKAATIMNSQVSAQVVGAAALDFSRDLRPGETRFGNASGGAVGFFVFAKGSSLNRTDFFALRQLNRTVIGSVGGLSQLSTSSLVSGEGLPGYEQLAHAAVAGAFLYSAVGPMNKGLGLGLEKLGQSTKAALNSKHLEPFAGPLQSKYHELRYDLRELKTDLRRSTYAKLNEYGLRHPLRRSVDSAFSSQNAFRNAGPELTAENNPILAFERELPAYLERVKQSEKLWESAPAKEKYDRHREFEAMKADFSHRLMLLWYGDSGRPGIVSHTDKELATATVSEQRVAQIRDALTASNKANYPNESPLTQKLMALLPEGSTDHLSSESYAVAGISRAREKFYGFDENALFKQMSMPRLHAIKDHSYGTPAHWMPFEPTANLPNFFHGTVSSSLSGLFRERLMLPAAELRLRGIEQKTGESATEDHPRRWISMTRDFNEAWAYHRHSPERLTDFPVVFGISKAVAPRAWPAGTLEPGEILIDKLRLGSSLFTRLGLRAKEISHIYVPDAEVANVTGQLAAHRLRGIKVIALSELESPPWKPPTQVELAPPY